MSSHTFASASGLRISATHLPHGRSLTLRYFGGGAAMSLRLMAETALVDGKDGSMRWWCSATGKRSRAAAWGSSWWRCGMLKAEVGELGEARSSGSSGNINLSGGGGGPKSGALKV